MSQNLLDPPTPRERIRLLRNAIYRYAQLSEQITTAECLERSCGGAMSRQDACGADIESMLAEIEEDLPS